MLEITISTAAQYRVYASMADLEVHAKTMGLDVEPFDPETDLDGATEDSEWKYFDRLTDAAIAAGRGEELYQLITIDVVPDEESADLEDWESMEG